MKENATDSICHMTNQQIKKAFQRNHDAKVMQGNYTKLSFEQFFFVTNLQGSKDQLKEVWEEADGLDPNEFDPKTFFKLHGKRLSFNLMNK